MYFHAVNQCQNVSGFDGCFQLLACIATFISFLPFAFCLLNLTTLCKGDFNCTAFAKRCGSYMYLSQN